MRKMRKMISQILLSSLILSITAQAGWADPSDLLGAFGGQKPIRSVAENGEAVSPDQTNGQESGSSAEITPPEHEPHGGMPSQDRTIIWMKLNNLLAIVLRVTLPVPPGPWIRILTIRICQSPDRGTNSSGRPSTPPAANPPARTDPATSTIAAGTNERQGITLTQQGGSTWSSAQKDAAQAVFDSLPAEFRKATRMIVREPNSSRTANFLGYIRTDSTDVIHMTDLIKDPAQFQRVLVHEMAHAYDYSHPELLERWKSIFWKSGQPSPPSPSAYGNTSPREDFAESVRDYWAYPQDLKRNHPDRYLFIRNFVMAGKEFLGQTHP